MVKVVITRDACQKNSLGKNKILSIAVKGHANSAPYGQDLVCAAVSSILTGGANALLEGYEANPNFKVILDEGNALIERTNEIDVSDNQETVLETIAIMLKTIEESYSKFIKIEEKSKN
ncbi:MAG: ribosomal-processing cysteine protease Prp [Bacilli bacterium]|nr:ribosomal-processing cysteine protease Prp [Bacilli bacterium]